jgi:hypothetical protein
MREKSCCESEEKLCTSVPAALASDMNYDCSGRFAVAGERVLSVSMYVPT